MSDSRAVAILAAILFAFGSAPARADVVLPFSLQALFVYTQSGPMVTPTPFNATVLIDTTTGTVENFSSPSFNNPLSAHQGPVSGSNTYFWSAIFGFAPNSITLVFETPSLVGYTGGSLVNFYHPDAAGDYTVISEVHVPPQVLVSGFLTPLSVPEPSSLAILAAGAFGSMAWRGWGATRTRSRRRRAQNGIVSPF